MKTLKTLMNHVKKEGIKPTIEKSFARVATRYNFIPKSQYKKDTLEQTYHKMNTHIQSKEEIKGLYFINAAHGFEEVFNQRTINFAKYLAQNNYIVAYIRWQWDYADRDSRDFTQVYPNIFQLPLFPFLLNKESLAIFNENQKEKGFISTFPVKSMYDIFSSMKSQGYNLYYDIMDEWEEFSLVGQAPWYERETEENYIKISDHVVAVSAPLQEKFQHLKPIDVVGNGYSVAISKYPDIACKTKKEDGKIHIGYFGHMTEDWFDWDVVFHLADNPQNEIHLVGHGMSDATLEKMNTYNNIHFYGKVHPSELHTYVKEWHIGLIPFKPSVLSKAVDPIKIYEYVFFGLETISTGIPHIGKYPTVTHLDDPSTVVEVAQSIYEKIEKNEEDPNRQQFLHETTWDYRFDQILKKQ